MHYQKQWATVPLNKHQIPIFEVEIANNDWISKLSRSLKVAYGNTAYFSLLNEIIIPEFEKKYNHIADLNISLIIKISRWLGISKVKFISDSLNLLLQESFEGHLDEEIFQYSRYHLKKTLNYQRQFFWKPMRFNKKNLLYCFPAMLDIISLQGCALLVNLLTE